MKTLKSFIASHADGLEALFKFSAAHTCRSLLHSLEGYISLKRLTFGKLTPRFCLSFEHYLITSGCSRNTSACYLRAFHAICQLAEQQNLLTNADALFKEVFMGYEETAKRALSLPQLRTLANADLTAAKNLQMARDFFILSYYLRGIPFIDLAYLRRTDIRGNTLSYRRSKTGRYLTITLEPWMWEIINRYRNADPKSPYLLRIIRRQGTIPEERQQYESALRLYNKHLHRLSLRLELGVTLTSYVARHTWATLAYNEDVPVSKISEALSHASEEITYTYLRSFSAEQLAAVNLMMASLINPMAEKKWKERGKKKMEEKIQRNVPIPNRNRNIFNKQNKQSINCKRYVNTTYKICSGTTPRHPV